MLLYSLYFLNGLSCRGRDDLVKTEQNPIFTMNLWGRNVRELWNATAPKIAASTACSCTQLKDLAFHHLSPWEFTWSSLLALPLRCSLVDLLPLTSTAGLVIPNVGLGWIPCNSILFRGLRKEKSLRDAKNWVNLICGMWNHRDHFSGSKNVVIQYKNCLWGTGSVWDGAITAHQTANRRIHKTTTTYSTYHEPQETPQPLQLAFKAVKSRKPSVKTAQRVLSHGSVKKN